MAATLADKVTELDQKLEELDGKQRAILDAADGDALSTEQRDEFDQLGTQYQETESAREQVLQDIERQNALSNRTIPEVASPGRSVQPADPHIRVKEKTFDCLGDQLQAIANVAMSGRENEMLQWENLALASGSAAAGVPSDGGYLIQKDFVTNLMAAMSAEGTLPAVTTIPIGANSDGLKMNVIDQTSRATGSRWGGVQVYWGAEGDAATAKKPKLRQMELELKELIGLAYASNRLLADTTALEAIFTQAFAEEMNFMREDSIINGTGAGQPKGILSTTGASATISVAKETGQAANTIVVENIVKMYSRMWARGRGTNAVWLINQDVEPQLFTMKLDVGTGGMPVYMPAGGVSQAPFATLMGRPVIPVEYCATLGTVGDIIFWNPTQYIQIEKGGMQADQSIHVRFTTNENTFRFITRVDGQPLWNSALTPFKGSNTQSPQITLATRS